jgi:hypothetical protein
MNAGIREILDSSFEIFNALLEGQDVGQAKNRELYERYRYNPDIEEMVQYIADKMGMELYHYNEKLFLSPGTGNRLFGYSNDDLKRRIPYITRNDELYLCYFIIMVLITMFYKESGIDTPINYVRFSSLVEEVSNRFEALINIEDVETLSHEYQFNFADICKVWTTLPDAREDAQLGIQQRGKNDKISFTRNVCYFLQDEGLAVLDNDRNLIFPNDRFKAIIYYYYEDRDNKNDILGFVNGLEGE